MARSIFPKAIFFKPNPVNDNWIFIFLYPAISILIIHIGNDNSLKELLRIPSYYSDLLLAGLCTFITGIYLRHLYHYRNINWNWQYAFRMQLGKQIGFGILLPVGFAIGSEIIYIHFLLHISLLDSSVFYLELPLTLLFLSTINLIYTLLYYKHHNQLLLQKANTIDPSTTDSYKHYIVVEKGSRSFNIAIEQIAYFIILEKSTFLITIANEKFLYNDTLDNIIEQVNPIDFFQLNRQIIAKRSSVTGFSNTDTRRLKIEIMPPPGEDIFVSKARARDFLDWLR